MGQRENQLIYREGGRKKCQLINREGGWGRECLVISGVGWGKGSGGPSIERGGWWGEESVTSLTEVALGQRECQLIDRGVDRAKGISVH